MGKSYASIRLAELLAKQIHGDKYKIEKRNIIKNLLNLIRFIKGVKHIGEIIVIEEMSVLFPSRRAMSGVNVDANAIIDTVRKKILYLPAKGREKNKLILSRQALIVKDTCLGTTMR